MSNQGTIIRGDDQTISIPVSNLFPVTLGGSAVLYVVPIDSTPPDTFVDSTALITSNLGPFATNVTSFDFPLTSATGVASSLIPVETYDWYARFKDASGRITTISLSPDCVEVIAPGDDC